MPLWINTELTDLWPDDDDYKDDEDDVQSIAANMPTDQAPNAELQRDDVDYAPHPFQPPQPRGKPMEVLCLGLSRTATFSTYIALRKLGIESYHCVECGRNAANNNSFVEWREAIEAKFSGGKGKRLETAEDFDRLLWRYQGVTDIPCVLFADELVKAYPDAKVVLTERDVEGWIKSVQNSFIEILSWRVWTFLEYFDAGYCGQYIPIIRLPLHIWTKGDPYNLDKLRQGYKDHNDHIRQLVPQERLLVWHPRDGWEPLCKHLGKPVPKEPVPKLNEGMYVAKLHQWVVTVRLLAVATKALKIAAPVAAAGLGLWCYRGM